MGEPTQAPLCKYEIVAPLAEGGMALLDLALMRGDLGFQRLVVLKRLRPEYRAHPHALALFAHEARVLARLNHPNLIQTHEVYADEAGHVIVMEHLEGITYGRLARQPGGLALGAHLRILCDVLAGLHAAHELTDFDGSPLSVVHRDISPGNVFVTFSGQVKVLDFGIASGRLAGEEDSGISTRGKPAYMAPEQLRGEAVTRQADIFSVGILLWEALVGRRLFDNVARRVESLEGKIPSVSEVSPFVPRALDAICMRALAKNPEERYPTAQAMGEALQDFAESTGVLLGATDLVRHVEGRHVARHVEEMKTVSKRVIRVLTPPTSFVPPARSDDSLPPSQVRPKGGGDERGSLSPVSSEVAPSSPDAEGQRARWGVKGVGLFLLVTAGFSAGGALARASMPDSVGMASGAGHSLSALSR